MRFLIILLSLTFFGCRNNETSLQSNLFEQGFVNSNAELSNDVSRWLTHLDERLIDPQTATRAQLFQPMWAVIARESNSMINYLRRMRLRIDKSANQQLVVDSLRTRYLKLQQDISDLIPSVAQDNLLYDSVLRRQLFLLDRTTPLNDWRTRNIDSFYTALFKNSDRGTSKALLEKIINDILITERALLIFVYENSNTYFCGFEQMVPLINQNTTVLKPGQHLQIQAGFGGFKFMPQTKIWINDRLISHSEEALAVYEFNVGQKAGKYSIPIEIETSFPGGSRHRYRNTIYYEVTE